MTPSIMQPPIIPVPLPSGLYYGWVIVAAALVINMAAASLNPVVFSFFLSPMGQDMGWSRGDLALAFTFRLVAAGATGVLVGFIIDRFGPRWLGVFAGLVAAGSLAGLFFSHQLWLFYLLFAVSGGVGLSEGGGGNLLTSVTVAKWFVAKRGRAMAIATVGFPGGTVILIPIAQWLIQTFGWREAWLVLGIVIGVVVIPLSVLFMRRSPADMGLLPDGATGGPDPLDTSRPVLEVDWTVGEALRTPVLWLILTALALMGLARTGVFIHRVAYWEEVGMSPALVAIGTTVDPITVVLSGLVFGVIGEKVRTRYLGLAAGCGTALAMLPMILTSGQAYTIFAHNIIWGIAAGPQIAVNNLIWPGYFGRRFLGTILGVVLPVSVAATGVGPPLYGYLMDAGLPPAVLWTTSLVVFMTAGVLLFLAKPPRRRAT